MVELSLGPRSPTFQPVCEWIPIWASPGLRVWYTSVLVIYFHGSRETSQLITSQQGSEQNQKAIGRKDEMERKKEKAGT